MASEFVGVQRIGAAVRRVLGIVGPGVVTGASDDDPSGIATYATAGASLGYATLWTALATFPLMAAVQLTCARIGLVSRQGLAGVLRQHYSRVLLYAAVFGLVVANTINAGTDIGAIAAAINLLVPLPITALVVPVAVLIFALQIGCSYRVIERVFKWLTLALFAYIGSAFFARPDWGAVLRSTFIPTLRLDSTYLATLVALLGTTISPYLFFWQSDQEAEEEGQETDQACNLQIREGVELDDGAGVQCEEAEDARLRHAAWDVDLGMLLSNVVAYFIILATGATLFQVGKTDIATAADAAAALRPLAGDAASVLLALGLIGSGLLAVPILTGSAAYALSEAFGWPYGFDQRLPCARQFYGIIAASTLVGVLINFVGISPVRALFWTAVINGFLAPPLLLIILHVANNRRVMGVRTNGRTANVLGWITTVVMFAAAIGLVLTWVG